MFIVNQKQKEKNSIHSKSKLVVFMSLKIKVLYLSLQIIQNKKESVHSKRSSDIYKYRLYPIV